MTEEATLSPEYQHDQEQLARIYKAVAAHFLIPPLDPEKDYVINAGCGNSPDQIAIQRAFAEQGDGPKLPVVGIDLDLRHSLEGTPGSAQDNVGPEDRVELITGDAAKVIPEVAARKGPSKVVTARNMDAMFDVIEDAREIPRDNPLLQTRWADVVQAAYAALDEDGGYFVATYKAAVDLVPLADYLIRAGFICMPLENRFGIGRWQQEGLVKRDLYVVVGVKKMPAPLVAKIQQTHPDFTPERYRETYKEALAQEVRIKQRQRYKKVQEKLGKLPKQETIDLLLKLTDQEGIALSVRQRADLQALAQADTKLVIVFTDPESYTGSSKKKDAGPEKATLLKGEWPGARYRITAAKVEKRKDSDGKIALGIEHHTVTRPAQKSDPMLDSEIPQAEVVWIFADQKNLEVMEKMIEENRQSENPKEPVKS